MTEKETEGRLAQIELADAVAGERARRANAALIGPSRFSLPEDATDPRFAAVEGRTVAEKRAAFAEAAVADFVAADAKLLGHVDELLRWAQGRIDRDLLRDRICRELGPLLRERMGRKLG